MPRNALKDAVRTSIGSWVDELLLIRQNYGADNPDLRRDLDHLRSNMEQADRIIEGMVDRI